MLVIWNFCNICPRLPGGRGGILCPEIFRSLKFCYPGKKCLYLSLGQGMRIEVTKEREKQGRGWEGQGKGQGKGSIGQRQLKGKKFLPLPYLTLPYLTLPYLPNTRAKTDFQTVNTRRFQTQRIHTKKCIYL